MTHLTIEHREIIEESLKEKMSFTDIANLLGYHRTSISAEVKNRRSSGNQNLYGTNFVYCELEKECSNFIGIGCRKKCSNFKPKQCPILNKPPYVCNGCSKKNGCRYNKFYYRANDAQKDYESLLKEAREGIRLTQEEIQQINEIICPLIKKQNQSVNQVYINHPDILYFSKNEFYNLINNGYLDNELPRGKPSIVHRTIASLRERGIIPSVLTNAIFYEASLGELNPKRLNPKRLKF